LSTPIIFIGRLLPRPLATTPNRVVGVISWCVATSRFMAAAASTVVASGTGADERDEVGRVHCAPTRLGSFDQLERHGDTGRAGARPPGDLALVTYRRANSSNAPDEDEAA
jgi:hypothetical protein